VSDSEANTGSFSWLVPYTYDYSCGLFGCSLFFRISSLSNGDCESTHGDLVEVNVETDVADIAVTGDSTTAGYGDLFFWNFVAREVGRREFTMTLEESTGGSFSPLMLPPTNDPQYPLSLESAINDRVTTFSTYSDGGEAQTIRIGMKIGLLFFENRRYRVRFRATSGGPDINAVSEAMTVSIGPPNISFRAPSSSTGSLQLGQSYEVRWSPPGGFPDDARVVVLLVKEGSASPIARSPSNASPLVSAGSYQLSLPATTPAAPVGTKYVIQLQLVGFSQRKWTSPRVELVSPNQFCTFSLPPLPDGRFFFTLGSTVQVKWTCKGYPSSTKAKLTLEDRNRLFPDDKIIDVAEDQSLAESVPHIYNYVLNNAPNPLVSSWSWRFVLTVNGEMTLFESPAMLVALPTAMGVSCAEQSTAATCTPAAASRDASRPALVSTKQHTIEILSVTFTWTNPCFEKSTAIDKHEAIIKVEISYTDADAASNEPIVASTEVKVTEGNIDSPRYKILDATTISTPPTARIAIALLRISLQTPYSAIAFDGALYWQSPLGDVLPLDRENSPAGFSLPRVTLRRTEDCPAGPTAPARTTTVISITTPTTTSRTTSKLLPGVDISQDEAINFFTSVEGYAVIGVIVLVLIIAYCIVCLCVAICFCGLFGGRRGGRSAPAPKVVVVPASQRTSREMRTRSNTRSRTRSHTRGGGGGGSSSGGGGGRRSRAASNARSRRNTNAPTPMTYGSAAFATGPPPHGGITTYNNNAVMSGGAGDSFAYGNTGTMNSGGFNTATSGILGRDGDMYQPLNAVAHGGAGGGAVEASGTYGTLNVVTPSPDNAIMPAPLPGVQAEHTEAAFPSVPQ